MDVIIAGAGPVGLFLACELALANCSVLILVKELEVHKCFKNPHKTSAPAQGPRRQGGHFAGIPFLDGNIDTAQWKYRLPSSTDTNLISEMEELESGLAC